MDFMTFLFNERVRILKYGLIGLSGLFVSLLGFHVASADCHCSDTVSSCIGTLLSLVHNFMAHNRLTWKDRASSDMRESLKRAILYFLVSFVGMLFISMVVHFFFILRWNLLLGQTVAIGGVSVVSFWFNHTLNWKK